MSNLIVGDIFEKVIKEVVTASQTDFEENGVNQQTLIELEQTWHQKLSVRNVAQMPWDPKPEPSPQPAPAHSQIPSSHTVPSYNASQPQGQLQNGARIKSENAPDQSYNGGGYQQPMNPELAQQRAASLLHQQYGGQATASLSAMQQRGIALPGQQQQGKPGLQLPGQPQNIQYQYAQQLKQQQQAQQSRIKTETDGASDDIQPFKRQRLEEATSESSDAGMAEWQAYMAARRAITDEQRAENDASMRQYVSEMSRGLENGLMQPLKQTKRRGQAARARRNRLPGIPQLDGDFSDDEKKEDDEDAINSDLDDADELDNAEEDDDEIDSMLCTYDKVQRVKNKWKCTLKDGVLSANGKEYLFHKAQGEFEW